MADIKRTTEGLKHCLARYDDGLCDDCPYMGEIDRSYMIPMKCKEIIMRDVLELLKSQHTEIERMKAEKNRVIEHIESEIHRLFKERGCVKDDVGIAQYQWLINGYQSALDMIKDGEQE